MKGFIKQIKFSRFPKEVLKLIDILNNTDVVKYRNKDLIYYSDRIVFIINQFGNIQPDDHIIILYVFDVSHYYMEDIKKYKEFIITAIENSKYSNLRIVW